MNTYQIKVVGSAELSQAIETDKSVRLGFDVEVYSVEKFDNQDGTFTIRYKTKITSPVDVMQGEKIFRGKDKTKASQRLRWRLMAKGTALGLDPEEYYQSEINKIIESI